MSLYDYQRSKVLAAHDEPFYALIMAAMRKADDANAKLLSAAWPGVWNELWRRYGAPGGRIGNECEPIESLDDMLVD